MVSLLTSNSGYAAETNTWNALWFSARETLAPYVNIDRVWESAQQNKEYVIAGTIVTATALALGIIKCCCNKKKPAPSVPHTAARAAAAGTAALATGPNASVTPAAGAKSPAAATTGASASTKSPAAGSASAAAAGVTSPAAGSGKDFKAGKPVGQTPAGQTAAGSAGAATAADKKAPPPPKLELPKFETTFSGEIVEVKITTPREPPKKIKLSIVFCADISTSMDEKDAKQITTDETNPTILVTRIEEVVRVVKSIFTEIEKTVQKSKDAEIKVTVIQFNTASTYVVAPTLLASTMKASANKANNRDHKASQLTQTVASIKQAVGDMKTNGSTELIQAFAFATDAIEQVAKDMQGAEHLLVLMTDGEQQLSHRDLQVAQELKQRLAALNAKSYLVGMGEGHTKATLQALAPENKQSGRYIDTTGDVTIERAVMEAFNSTMRQFQFVVSSQLPAGTWGANGKPSYSNVDGVPIQLFGNMGPFEWNNQYIRVYPTKMDPNSAPFTPTFTVHVTHPNGDLSQKKIEWNAPITPSVHHGYLRLKG